MNSFIKYISFVFAISLVISCGDTDGYLTNAVLTENLEKGGLVRFENLTKFTEVVDFTAFNTGFDEVRTIYDPNDNLTSVSFDIISTVSGVTDTVTNVFSSSTFPFDMNMNKANLGSWLGIDANTLLPGDQFLFIANATRNDGVVFNLDNTNTVLASDARGGYAHAMNFVVSLACPFVPAEAVGNYMITNDPFGTTLDATIPIEAVLNDAGDGIIFKDLFKHPEAFDVEVIFSDPALGLVSVARQPAWHCDNFGCPYGEGRVDGSGTFFTCIGVMSVNLSMTVDAGSFGTFNVTLVKS